MAILNIPTYDDFYTSGKELLDFSWDVIASLLTNMDEAEYYGVDPIEISDKYWSAAKRRLTTALSISQQGVEFILKGQIVAISPFLLISESPSKWPSPYDGNQINFSEFRTINAQDLIRVIDTFSPIPMSKDFVDQFHQLREKRNRIMHSVDKQLTVDVAEAVDSILFMHKALFPEETWASIRLRFLDEAPDSELGGNEFSRNRVCWEIKLAINLLKPSKVKKYFGIDKKQRRYVCPTCLLEANTDAGFDHKLAVLKPTGPKSTILYCPVCDATYNVTRGKCHKVECPGNVLDDKGMCLTCCGWV
ncbi:hypothetical protein [Desulfosediminicola sp.]|uniref:hypothetical protein n=1 Tax=Desulfosediminicola sp. TaxID=2886825 RepID=UPI003AF1F91F